MFGIEGSGSGIQGSGSCVWCLGIGVWEREFKLRWREAGPPYDHDDKVDLDQ